jgi:hypothetical protein
MYCLRNKTTIIRGGFVQIFLLCSVLMIIAGCDQKRSTVVFYYPVDSLMSAQISVLSKMKPSVRKTGTMGAAQSANLLKFDSAGWVKELELFRNLNEINKPVNADVYDRTEAKDVSSNLTVRTFSVKPGRANDDTPVRMLKIYYLKRPSNIRKLEALYFETNAMYNSTKNLSMEFEDFQGRPLLSGYGVSGGQKMFLGDSVSFSITASVVMRSN